MNWWNNMGIFINAFLMVFFAEMGDKSQILAMSFAAKYPIKKVAVGIAIGVIANHGLAVGLGYFLGKMLPMSMISLLAGLLFLAFGLLSFKIEDQDDEQEDKIKFSIVTTIALAFFIGEFGDKTQLTATALASSTAYPFIVLAGTVSAMLVTAALGVVIGLLLGKKMPELAIKLVSGLVFIGFGTQKLFDTVPWFTQGLWPVAYFSLLLVITTYFIMPMYAHWRSGQLLPMQRMAQTLKEVQAELKSHTAGLCFGEATCGACRGNACIVGQTKTLIDALEHRDQDQILKAIEQLEYRVDRHFNQQLAQAGLNVLIAYRSSHPDIMESVQGHMQAIESRLNMLASRK